MNFLVTGGAGFIGSAFIRMLMEDPVREAGGVNLDKLPSAGTLENRTSAAGNSRYRFVHGDICDDQLVGDLIAETQPDVIVNFAAESHVDRSILSPEPGFKTTLQGTFQLME